MKVMMLLLFSIELVLRAPADVIDLSHKHGPDTIMLLNSPHFNRTTIFDGEILPGVYSQYGYYLTGEHGGTHIDAPVHFQKDGRTLDEIPLENTIAEGVMIDCSKEASKLHNFKVTINKILEWEELYEQIPFHAAVIFNFGWSSKFANPAEYKGTNSTGDLVSFVFPSVSQEAGDWLYDNRNIKIIGTDTLSPDAFSASGLPIHQKYLPNNRLIVENLNGMGRLPPIGFIFHTSPVKFVGATGAQVRAYAMTYDRNGCFGYHNNQVASYLFIALTVMVLCVLQVLSVKNC